MVNAESLGEIKKIAAKKYAEELDVSVSFSFIQDEVKYPLPMTEKWCAEYPSVAASIINDLARKVGK